MYMGKQRKEFWLTIVDEDQKQFSVEGPMTSDKAWNKAIVQAQEQGRRIQCSSSFTDQTTKESIRVYRTRQGYTEVTEPIVRPDW
jgi:hypothetical protein